MGKKKGKYQGKKKDLDRSWLLWLLAIPLWIGFLFLEGSPKFQSLRDTLWYILVWKLLISGVILFFTYFAKQKQTLTAKIILSACACVPWMTMLGCSERFLLIIVTLLAYVLLGYLLYFNVKKRKGNNLVMYIFAYFALIMLEELGTYTYIDQSKEMQYWYWYLTVGIAVGVSFGALAFKEILYLKDGRVSEKVCVGLLAAFMGFVLPWVTVENANYMLDTSEPTVYELTIGEKNLETHPKSGADYCLIVGLDGKEIQLEVSQSEYYQYEVGDKIPISLYEGFLGKPYYIYEQ